MRNALLLPELEIIIDDSLGYTISIFGWLLPEDHELYLTHLRTVRNITVSDLVKEVESGFICPGVQQHELASAVVSHTVPKYVDPLFDDQDTSGSFPHLQYWRTRGCSLLLEGKGEQCDVCSTYSHASELKERVKEKKLAEPAHINSPVSKTPPERIKLTLQKQRLKCANLEKKLNEMTAEIENSSVEVDHGLSNDIATILSQSKEITPFMSLFYLKQWKESTLNRPGNFTANARSRMFLSWQTYVGLKITSYSVVEATKFLLDEGVEYVLTERFCQDSVEEYFGSQRNLRRRCDNPDIRRFGYNDNTIRIQRSVSSQSGNTRGRKDKNKAWVNVTDDPLPKRKRQ